MNDRLRSYYDGFDEWARLDAPPGQLEWLRTNEVIARWTPPGSRVLDLGGGPGRYALALARAGHQVTLADLSPRLVAEGARRAAEAGVALEAVEGDARDLGRWDDGCFDVVLAFGPFYHLVEAADRVVALREIARVLRPGGVLLAAVMPRLAGVRGLIQRMAFAPSHLAPDALARALAEGVFVNASDSGFPGGWFPSAEETRALFGAAFEELGFESLRGIAAGLAAEVLALQGAACTDATWPPSP